eukprot:TRINITY_DN5821_c0_g1_i1.p1 TRINITY_DN5821_c0_g1~~TRINITY_DN5821_c0_g1_i1.p1  ORF type:complete len:640 (+),score=159.46 TRINITY_DN5821_c0_g1_i1:371-2290(+)
MLLERDAHLPGGALEGHKGRMHVVTGHLQALHQAAGGYLAVLAEQGGAVLLAVLAPLYALGHELLLDARVYLPGGQLHGAGELFADAALAADQGVHLKLQLGAALGAQLAHDLVGVEAVAQQVARAEVAAARTLTAGHPGHVAHPLQVLALVGHHVVPRGQQDHPAGGLGHRRGGVNGHRSHHGPAHQHLVIVHRGAAGLRDDLLQGGADGHPGHHGPGHLAAHGQVTVSDRLVLYGLGDVDKGLHVGDHRAHHEREASFGHHPAQDLIDQHLLVASRVEVVQLEQLQAVAVPGQGLAQRGHGVIVLALEAHRALAGPGGVHDQAQAVQHQLGHGLHEIGVAHKQRLAGSPVGQHPLHLRVQLDVGGKTGTAGAHHARLTHFAYDLGLVHCLPSRPGLSAKRRFTYLASSNMSKLSTMPTTTASTGTGVSRLMACMAGVPWVMITSSSSPAPISSAASNTSPVAFNLRSRGWTNNRRRACRLSSFLVDHTLPMTLATSILFSQSGYKCSAFSTASKAVLTAAMSPNMPIMVVCWGQVPLRSNTDTSAAFSATSEAAIMSNRRPCTSPTALKSKSSMAFLAEAPMRVMSISMTPCPGWVMNWVLTATALSCPSPCTPAAGRGSPAQGPDPGRPLIRAWGQ